MSERTEVMLREHLRSVEVAVVPAADVVERGIVRFEHRATRRRRALAATSSLAAVALVVGVVWNTSASQQHITASDGVPSSTAQLATTDVPIASLPEGNSPWSAIPPSPHPLSEGTVVWTGTEALMIGGTSADKSLSFIDAYNPTTLQWRVVSEDVAIGGNPLAFWSGTALVLIGSADRMVVQYDPDSGLTFRQQTDHALGVDATVPFVWTGHELLVWPTRMPSARRPRALDPQSGLWRIIAEPPIEARTNAASIWTGSEWIVWGGSSSESTYLADGAAYNPSTDTWRVLAESPLSARQPPAIWTGTEMIIAAGFNNSALADGAAYDPVTDTWRKIASGLAHPGFTPIWTGEIYILFAKGGAVWYSPTTDQWSSGDFDWGDVPHLDGHPVWTGQVVLLLGSYDGTTGGAAFTPPAT